MSQTLSLESVSKQFTAWRETYHSPRHTPEALKQEAVALKANYPVSHIIKVLGINHRTLTRWSVRYESTPSSDFISLPALFPENKITIPQLLAICEFPNGIQLKLPHDYLNMDLLSLIYQLKPENKS